MCRIQGMFMFAMFAMPNEMLALSSLRLEWKEGSTLSSVWPQIQSHDDDHDVKKLAEKLRQRHSAEDTLLEDDRSYDSKLCKSLK